MSDKSKIEWTDATWNPVTGCTKVSAGCANCYAEVFSERFRGVKDHPFEQGFDLKLWPERLRMPLRWKSRKRIFVNSMSDLFHEDVPEQFIKDIFDVMNKAKQHIFQVLTKRHDRMLALTDKWFGCGKKPWPENVWLGVTVENQHCLSRVDRLQHAPAKVKFISFEPLIGRIVLNSVFLKNIHWVIVGGESGPRARPMKAEWVDTVYSECKKNKVPFFFKQWGAYNAHGKRVGKKTSGRELYGRTWNDMPVVLSQV